MVSPNQDNIEHWLCFCCFKPISNLSPNRPPILNLSNCPCSEAGTALNDPYNASHPHITAGNNPATIMPALDSSRTTSESGSAASPSDLSSPAPAARFLPLGPAIGLGEAQHRRRASFDEIEAQLDYSLQRYLSALSPAEQSYHGPWGPNMRDAAWLRQDPFLGPEHVNGGGGAAEQSDSMRAVKGSSLVSSGLSGLSAGSSGWMSGGGGVDPVLGAGDWMEESVYGAWPAVFDDDNADGRDNA